MKGYHIAMNFLTTLYLFTHDCSLVHSLHASRQNISHLVTVKHVQILVDRMILSNSQLEKFVLVLKFRSQELPLESINGQTISTPVCLSFAFTGPAYVSVHFNLILPRCHYEAAHFSRSQSHSQWLSSQVQRCRQRKLS